MKFAQVGYGSKGLGGQDKGGYTYVVNDNVKTGDKLNVLVKHAQSQEIFATTGKVLTQADLQAGKDKAIQKGKNVDNFPDKGLSRSSQFIKTDSNGNIVIENGQVATFSTTTAMKNTDLGVRKSIGGTSEQYTLEARRNLMSFYNEEKGGQVQFSKGTRTTQALEYQTPKEQTQNESI